MPIDIAQLSEAELIDIQRRIVGQLPLSRRLVEPEFLFRYRSLSSNRSREDVEQILAHRQIRFSSPTWFNDPFDCKVPSSHDVSDATLEAWLRARCWREIGSEIEENSGFLAENPPDFDTRVAQRYDALWPNHHRIVNADVAVFQQYFNNCGVLSLSERCDDILLWSHYADGHQGVCLCFQRDALNFPQDPDLKPPKQNVFQPPEKMSYPGSYPTASFVSSPPWEWYRAWMLTKSAHWCYEREWRVILQPKKGPGWKDTVETLTGTRHGWQSLPAHALIGVILGCSVTPENERTVREWLGFIDAKVLLLRARKKPERFELEIVDAD